MTSEKNLLLISGWKRLYRIPSSGRQSHKIRDAFAMTYFCLAGFPILLYLKSMKRNKLEVEDHMRLKMLAIQPDISSQKHHFFH